MKLSQSHIDTFQSGIRAFYAKHGRVQPWRETRDPYAIAVSEFMLQQTQVPRALTKYGAFLAKFPDVQTLAAADLREVLAEWKGLGYNRRAKLLRDMAAVVVDRFGGEIPPDEDALKSLPGIGPYTAGAIRAFAFNLPAVIIETNIRSVFIHTFFKDAEVVSDADIFPLVEQTLDGDNPREWYYALMDYGTFLKSAGVNPSRASRHYTKQSPFEGSDRQIRGRILELLLAHEPQTGDDLCAQIDADQPRILSILEKLAAEDILAVEGGYRIA